MKNPDVIIVGAGPAGLMAAVQSAGKGLRTIVLEKKHLPARKLGITGKGRCNLTNTADPDLFLKKIRSGATFIRFSLGRFSNHDLVDFFNGIGVETVEERGGRIFPASQKASTIVRALINQARKQGAVIWTNSSVKEILTVDGRVSGVVVLQSGNKDESGPVREEVLLTRNLILATGGASYPATGSTGDGYVLAKTLGHEVVPVRPALVPLETADDLAPRMQGLSLRNVSAAILVQNKKKDQEFGEMIFTHFGVSGPIVLSLSKTAVLALDQGKDVSLLLDLKPAVSHAQLKSRIARLMHEQGKKKIVNILKEILPVKMISVFLHTAEIDPDKPGNLITGPEQQKLRLWCKELKLDICGYRSFNEAIVTSGGVKLAQVNPRTMASRLVDGLYFAGEVLDVDADTGGYNLQAAFSTGWVAGNSVE
ncbi:NAD(P)/FAD-dependent oxidoreductase [Desulfonatronovibrio hydrogenovorans]|uniref:NAD(P)/FAD-dependent oxidoreductase n=1 Tax=Desulfonatronovibrio hydrogenovorans TaxID=53245 RepID=UPI000558A282|nr:NAD(P)/FAD-dependent oxidoreductase [Desulfonatronovibrio hydrogenovorans]